MFSHLNSLITTLSCGLLLTSSIQEVKASHSMGSDITYRCLGNNQYEVTLSFYRDCAGVPADAAAFIDFSSSCFPSGTEVLQLIAGTGQEITPLCPSQVSTCNGGTFTGVQEYIYRGIITLPGPCADWTFSYNLCCRNAAITNIDFPASTQIYVYATLNNLITPCNNSPSFSNLPVPFVCLGQQYCYNHGAYDVDGDSLVYSLITPFDSPGFIVGYNGTFSASQPLSSSPPVSFNAVTGDICVTPTNLEVTVMAVLVSEYRNGILIGSVERDIQVTVIDCNNQLPALSGINGTNSFTTSVCAGNQLCFTVSSSDTNTAQNTTVNWDFAIPGATFTVIPGNRQAGTFCWTPQASDINSNPYCFTATVQDDNCPFLGSQVFSYCINVRGLLVNAGPDVSVGCNSNTTVTAVASGGSAGYTYSWSNGSTGPGIFAGPGTYIVTASDGTCTAKDTVRILAGTNTPTAAFSMTYTCTNLSVQFTNQSSIAGGTITGYTWNFGDANSSTAISPSHTYTTVGNYQVMLITQAAGGCVDTLIQNLNLVNDQPNANFNLSNACLGTQVNFTDQSTSISSISGWSWNFGDASTSNVPGPAHVYTTTGTFPVKLLITNANGCSDSITQSLTIFPLPVVNAGNDISICEGTGVNLTGTGGGNYLWNPGNQTGSGISVSPLQTITYTLTVTNSNGCEAQDDVTVAVNPTPNLNPMPDENVCAGSTTTLTANGPGGASYYWTPGGNTGRQLIISPSVTSDYTVTATNGFGCSSNDTVHVIVNPIPVLNTNSTDASCFGATTGTATVSVSSGTSPFSYSWSNNGGTGATASGLSAGTYVVTVTDINGCSQTHSASVSEPPALNLVSTSSPTSCFGSGDGSASVTVSGGSPVYSYQWNTSGSTTASVQGLTAGTYTVIVTDINSCTQSVSVNVTEPAVLSLVTSTISTQCFGSSNGTATVNVSGGTPVYSYNWTAGAGTLNTISGLTAGNYSVTVTDANACTSLANVVINQPVPLQIATTSTPASCSTTGNGTAAAIASGGVSGYSYSWSPYGGNGATAASLIPGVYTCTVTDMNGCTTMNSVNVGNIGGPAISPASQTNVSCYGGSNGAASVNISSGTPPYSVVWNPLGGTNAQASNLSAGVYTISVTDINGCLATQQVTISQPAILATAITSTDITCFGMSNGSATVDVTGGTQPYSYVWNPGGAGSRIASSLNTGNYSVIITDALGCTRTVSTMVNQPPELVPVINSTELLCNGDSNASASVFVTGGVPAYNYLWTPGGDTTSSIQGLGHGNYSATITDAHGCTVLISTFISEPPGMTLSLTGAATICIGQSATLSAIVSGGTKPYSYLWNTGHTDSVKVISPTTSTVYSVQVVDSNGCPVNTQSVSIQVYPPLSVIASEFQVICEGDEANVSALASGGNGGPYAYSWNQGAIPGNNNTVSPVDDSTFTVTVTDACGTPAAVDSVLIEVHPLPQVAFLPHTIQGCTPVNAVFNNYSITDPGSGYFWNLGDQTTSTEYEPIHEYSEPGVYNVSLTVVSTKGCTARLNLPQVVTVYGYPTAAFSQSSNDITVLNPGIAFFDESADPTYWEWDFGDGSDPDYNPNPVHEYSDSGTYIVRLIVRSNGGCPDTTYSKVRVEMEFIINVPDAFTPNGDGTNDGFIAYGIGYTDYSMSILDRWGKKIYHSTDKNVAWDGTYFGNGNQCQADVYEWVLDVVDFKNKQHRLIGHVTLYR